MKLKRKDCREEVVVTPEHAMSAEHGKTDDENSKATSKATRRSLKRSENLQKESAPLAQKIRDYMPMGIMTVAMGQELRKGTLVGLPCTVLVQIFGYLSLENDVDLTDESSQSEVSAKLKYLAHLCLTCKQSQSLATPLLYETFPKPDTVSLSSPSLRRFLRTLIERPDFRLLVQRVAIGKSATKVSDQSLLECKRSREFKSLSLEASESFMQGKRYVAPDLEDTQIALLFCIVNHIPELSVRLPNSFETQRPDETYLSLLFTRLPSTCDHGNSPQPQGLPVLKCLSLTSCDTAAHGRSDLTCPSPRLSDIFRLEKLESFHGSGLFDYWSGWDKKSLNTSVRHLSLDVCSITASRLGKFLRLDSNGSNFESLKLIFHEYQDYTRFAVKRRGLSRDFRMTWYKLGKILRGLNENLQVLTLGTRGDRSDPESDLDVKGSIGSFKSFTALRELSIFQYALLGNGQLMVGDNWQHEALSEDYDIYDYGISQADLLDILPPLLHDVQDYKEDQAGFAS